MRLVLPFAAEVNRANRALRQRSVTAAQRAWSGRQWAKNSRTAEPPSE